MTSATRPKRTLVGIELYGLLAEEGHRVFTTEKAREVGAPGRTQGVLSAGVSTSPATEQVDSSTALRTLCAFLLDTVSP